MPYTKSQGIVKPITTSNSWKKIFSDNEECIFLGFDEVINSILASAAFLMHTDSCENVRMKSSVKSETSQLFNCCSVD
jgi:hypothetical protein